MSLDEHTQSDTPEDHMVIALELEVALLPEWFDAIKALAGEFARRMSVMEHPEVWKVKIELPKGRADDFRDRLGEAWHGFVTQRKEEGRWEAEPGDIN